MRYPATERDIKEVLKAINRYPGIQTRALTEKLNSKALPVYGQTVWSILEALKYKLISSKKMFGQTSWYLTAKGELFLEERKKRRSQNPKKPSGKKSIPRKGVVVKGFGLEQKKRVKETIEALHEARKETGTERIPGRVYNRTARSLHSETDPWPGLKLAQDFGYVKKHPKDAVNNQVSYSVEEEFLAENPLDPPKPDGPDLGGEGNGGKKKGGTSGDNTSLVGQLLRSDALPKYAKATCAFAFLAANNGNEVRKGSIIALLTGPAGFERSFAIDSLLAAGRFIKKVKGSPYGDDSLLKKVKECPYVPLFLSAIENGELEIIQPKPDKSASRKANRPSREESLVSAIQYEGGDIEVIFRLRPELLGKEVTFIVYKTEDAKEEEREIALSIKG